MSSVTTTKTFVRQSDRGGDVKMDFNFTNKKALDVMIQTLRLNMQSVTSKNRREYVELFGCPEVVEKYANGKPKTRIETNKRVRGWMNRWGIGYPYSAFAIYSKNTKTFVGNVILGEGDRPGQSEFAITLKKEVWNQGYGTEAAHAMKLYAQVLCDEGFLVQGKPLDEVVATARRSNTYSRRILKGIGMEVERTEKRVVDGRRYTVYHHRMPMTRVFQN